MPIVEANGAHIPDPRPAADSLKHYFASGWAFLIPYLLCYSIYALLRWPIQDAASEADLSIGAPPLLHLYWAIHGLHLFSGLHVLRTCWLRSRAASLPQETAHRILPWMLLALFFWLPGVYLEFPSDPWEHFARVNEWSGHRFVSEHSIWNKSNYFLGFSLVGGASPPWLFDLYYTGCCLLLCWQYFRLAVATGLDRRAATIFVFLQAVLMGNNVFGFYRYYGMTGALFSQLGAIVLIRHLIEASSSGGARQSGRYRGVWLLSLTARCLLLGLLIGLNHVQGFGIAGLGVAGVLGWHAMGSRRAIITWLAIAAVAANLAILVCFLQDGTVRHLQQTGWLGPWGGFNLLSPSPALERTWQILGIGGTLNLACGLFLLRTNHVVGWITCLPLLLLLTPLVAIPFSLAATQSNPANIVTFHRLLLGIPIGLALVVCVRRFIAWRTAAGGSQAWLGLLVGFALVLLVCLPAGRAGYNRFWQTVMIPPDDLRLSTVSRQIRSLRPNDHSYLLAPRSIGFLAQAYGRGPLTPYFAGFREIMPPVVPSHQVAHLAEAMHIAAERREPTVLWLLSPTHAYTPGSQAAFLSGHWAPYELALLATGESELDHNFRLLGVDTLSRR